jgi:hypothetical protein
MLRHGRRLLGADVQKWYLIRRAVAQEERTALRAERKERATRVLQEQQQGGAAATEAAISSGASKTSKKFSRSIMLGYLLFYERFNTLGNGARCPEMLLRRQHNGNIPRFMSLSSGDYTMSEHTSMRRALYDLWEFESEKNEFSRMLLPGCSLKNRNSTAGH